MTTSLSFYSTYNGESFRRPSANVSYLIYRKTAGYKLRWIKWVPGSIPTQAVVGGISADGFPIYIAGHSKGISSYDAHKDCVEAGPDCITDFYLLLLTSMYDLY